MAKSVERKALERKATNLYMKLLDTNKTALELSKTIPHFGVGTNNLTDIQVEEYIEGMNKVLESTTQAM